MFFLVVHFTFLTFVFHHQYKITRDEKVVGNAAINDMVIGSYDREWHASDSNIIRREPEESEQRSEIKVDHTHHKILVWTPIFMNYKFWDRYLHQPGMEDCPSVSDGFTCSYTFDRSFAVNTSDALLFHYIDIELDDLPYRNPEQKWILFVEDPPYLHGQRMKEFEGLFNWTLSYR
jgi:hypothetical protein